MAQLAGAALVAALFAGDDTEVQVTLFVPALLVGLAGYGVAGASNRSNTQAIILAGIVMVLGLAVASVKNFLVGH